MVYWADAEVSHKLAREWNDAAVSAHSVHPDRFVVLATLPMPDPDRALDELNRVSKLPGVRGIFMGTNINGRDLDDPIFEPIFARIEVLDLPVFLHPLGPAVGGERLQPYSFNNLVAFSIRHHYRRLSSHFWRRVGQTPQTCLQSVARGVLPTLIGRLDHGFKVIPQAKRMAQTPSAYLRRFTYDTIAHSRPVMEFVMAQIGADRIMLGSDYCFAVGYEQPVRFVEQLSLTPNERTMILNGTAAKLLKM